MRTCCVDRQKSGVFVRPTFRLARTARIARVAGLAVALAALAGGCAMHAPKTVGTAAVHQLPASESRNVIEVWQRRLNDYLQAAGASDVAALSQLPALRSAALRPGRIVFGATDIEAFVPERDGYDAFGLLVGKLDSASGPWYVFVVGAIERHDYRPVAIADIRVAALSMRHGATTWETGLADAEALARYSRRIDTSTALRFPAERDEFEMVACGQQTCVEEKRSGARWSIYLGGVAAQ